MKKRLLFVIDSLGIGGAEKSLVTLLNCINYNKFDVDLQLFSRGGAFEKYVPKEVKFLEIPSYLKYCSTSFFSKYFSLKRATARLRYSIGLRLNKKSTHPDKARLFWTYTSKVINKNKQQYDIAIAYSQGVPTFYVADKVSARKKIAWVNASLMIKGKTLNFNNKYYNKYNHIVAVSQSAKEILQNNFSLLNDKLTIIQDLIDSNFINTLSNEPALEISTSFHPILLTVARLNNNHKGYDIAIETCKILHDRGINFKWYALGDGSYRNDMIHYIEENNLQKKFILLGAKVNPYPYFKACDLYVQTSRHEGFGLSIAEARILNKPVVTTEFDAVWNQMVQGKNGIVVPIDATAVADAIQDLIENPEKMNAISDYQRAEKKGNIEELQKFYQLIES